MGTARVRSTPARRLESSRPVTSTAVNLVAVLVAVLALVFTIASFWWLHARRGSLEVAPPRSYAFHEMVRLRLPLTFFNTGAVALIVSDLRLVVIENEASREPLWLDYHSHQARP